MFKIAIIEDETRTREMLSIMVRHSFEAALIEQASGVVEGAKLITSFNPDIVLLDIQLQDGTGFDLLELFPDKTFTVIFSTAHEEYAIQAIKHAAFDYLLKPIDPDELKKAIQTSLEKRKVPASIPTKESSANPKNIIVSTVDSMFVLPTEKIIRFESEKNYTTIFMSDQRRIVVSKPLSDYHSLLQEPLFFRVHRSHIINMRQIDRYDKRDGGCVFMKNGDEIPISRNSKERFLALLHEI
jgi:two-component system, LytTR family, response regulator